MIVTFEQLRQISRRQSRRAKSLTRHQVAMKRCAARSAVLPLDQLRGLPLVTRDGDDCAALYFLWCGPQLIYVGQSKYVVSRVLQHFEDGKMFTHATHEGTHEAWLHHNEGEYVRRYSPPLNGTRHG